MKMEPTKLYYCERFDTDRPQFTNYKGHFPSSDAALEFFKKAHGNQLQCVYDEDFNIIFEVKE